MTPPAPRFTLRRAVPDDAPAIADVHVRSWRQAYRGIVPDAVLDGLSVERRTAFWRESLAQGAPEVWVAEDAAEGIVGWVAFAASRDADAAPGTGEVRAIYVLEGFWSAGVGRALWSTARLRLAEGGFSSATLWVLAENARAIRFYRAAGFGPAGGPGSHKQSAHGGAVLHEVRYAASLPALLCAAPAASVAVTS